MIYAKILKPKKFNYRGTFYNSFSDTYMIH
jgi:hypothetical protein